MESLRRLIARPTVSDEFEAQTLFLSAIRTASTSIFTELDASQWYEKKLLISTISAWARYTFIIETREEMAGSTSSSSSSSSRPTLRADRVEGLTPLDDDASWTRIKWFFSHFKKRAMWRNLSSLTQEKDLIFADGVYSLTLQYRYLLLLHDRVLSRKRSFSQDKYKNTHLSTIFTSFKSCLKLPIISWAFKRLRRRLYRRKLHYPKEKMNMAFERIRWKLLLLRARRQAMKGAAQHARDHLTTKYFRRLRTVTRSKLLNNAFLRRDVRIYQREFCRRAFNRIVGVINSRVKKKEIAFNQIRSAEEVLFRMWKRNALRLLVGLSYVSQTSMHDMDQAIRFRKFHLLSIGMDNIKLFCSVRKDKRRISFLGAKVFRKSAMNFGIERLKSYSWRYKNNVVSRRLSADMWERQRLQDSFYNIRVSMSISYDALVCFCKSTNFWKMYRLKKAMGLLCAYRHIRIKKREMLRSARSNFKNNIRDLLCSQWVYFYSSQREDGVRKTPISTSDGIEEGITNTKVEFVRRAKRWLNVRRNRKLASTSLYPSPPSSSSSSSSSSSTTSPSLFSLKNGIARQMPTLLTTEGENTIDIRKPGLNSYKAISLEKAFLATAKPRNNLMQIAQEVHLLSSKLPPPKAAFLRSPAR